MTCKGMRSVVLESPTLWKKISLQPHPHFTFPFEGEVNAFGTQSPSKTDLFLDFLVKNGLSKHVVELDITRSHLPVSILVKLFWIGENFPNVEKISLYECNYHAWRSNNLPYPPQINLMEEMYKKEYPSVKVLNLTSMCASDYSHEIGLLLSKRFPSLEKLFIRSWRLLPTRLLYRQGDLEEEDQFFNPLPNLTTLDISDPGTSLTLDFLKRVLQPLPKLKELYLYNTQEGVEEFLKEKGIQARISNFIFHSILFKFRTYCSWQR